MDEKPSSLSVSYLSYNVWDRVWKFDNWSDESLRINKAKVKTKLLLSEFKSESEWNIVDIGCGAGYFTEQIRQRCEGNIIGLDFSRVAIEMAKARLNDMPISFYFANATKTGLKSSSIDLAICCGIIEHIRDETLIIDEIHRILKPRGKIFVVSSNILSFIWPQRLVKQALQIWPFGYQKNWSWLRLREKLEERGFEIFRQEIIHSIGDYSFLARLDKILAIFLKNCGRYIILWGRKKA